LASSRSFHRKANSSPRRAPLNGASPTMVRGFRHDRYSKSAIACNADPPRVHWSDLRIRHSHVRVRLGASGLEPGEGPLHADAPAPC
jgi:hypothetical protein